jgi:cytidylate kinase
MNKGFVIAIDGPVAAGKGTIAPALARSLDGLYLYTGAMYRCVALACIEQGLDMHNGDQAASVLAALDIRFENGRIFLSDVDVTERIKEEDAASGSSVVAVFPEVRANLVQKQRQIGENAIDKGQIVVLEGRDTGTKVFPDALLKVYLTATDEVRAKRRLAQYKEQGRDADFEQILKEIQERDKRDTERATDPLPKNPEELDYFIVDNSELSQDETINKIMIELERKKGLI